VESEIALMSAFSNAMIYYPIYGCTQYFRRVIWENRAVAGDTKTR
jgi:hypothetical protein